MQKRNYQRELEQVITGLKQQERVPSLLLHSCCAPCSSYVLEYLSAYFRITVLYYNPNIYPREEYDKRLAEQKTFVRAFPGKHPIQFLGEEHREQEFYHAIKGWEHVPEGGERCFLCYELRLREAAKKAVEGRFDYFTTTLSISPLKHADKLNEVGERLAREYEVPYLCSDFKKKNGYKRSTELSREYQMYRQDYCGCVFSKRERAQAAKKQE